MKTPDDLALEDGVLPEGTKEEVQKRIRTRGEDASLKIIEPQLNGSLPKLIYALCPAALNHQQQRKFGLQCLKWIFEPAEQDDDRSKRLRYGDFCSFMAQWKSTIFYLLFPDTKPDIWLALSKEQQKKITTFVWAHEGFETSMKKSPGFFCGKKGFYVRGQRRYHEDAVGPYMIRVLNDLAMVLTDVLKKNGTVGGYTAKWLIDMVAKKDPTWKPEEPRPAPEKRVYDPAWDPSSSDPVIDRPAKKVHPDSRSLDKNQRVSQRTGDSSRKPHLMGNSLLKILTLTIILTFFLQVLTIKKNGFPGITNSRRKRLRAVHRPLMQLDRVIRRRKRNRRSMSVRRIRERNRSGRHVRRIHKGRIDRKRSLRRSPQANSPHRSPRAPRNSTRAICSRRRAVFNRKRQCSSHSRSHINLRHSCKLHRIQLCIQ